MAVRTGRSRVRRLLLLPLVLVVLAAGPVANADWAGTGKQLDHATVVTGRDTLCACAAERGAANGDGAVRAYVEALNLGDQARLAQVTVSDQEAEVKARMDRLGGESIRIDRVGVRPNQVNPGFAEAEVVGRSRTGPYREWLSLHQRDQRWYVYLGDLPAKGPTPVPAATGRS